ALGDSNSDRGVLGPRPVGPCARYPCGAGALPRPCGAKFRSRSLGKEHVVVRLRRPILQLCYHVAQIHRVALMYAYHYLLQILGAGEEVSSLNLEFLVDAGEAARNATAVGLLQLAH